MLETALLAVAMVQVLPGADALVEYNMRESEIQELVFSHSAEDRLQTTVVLGGRAVTLSLRKHSLRSPDFQVLVQAEAGGLVPVEPPPVYTYRGTVPELPGTEARATFQDRRLTGVIYTSAGVYGIQPLPGSGVGGAATPHLVYLADDTIHADVLTCRASSAGAPADTHRAGQAEREAQGSGLRVAEIGLDADFEYLQDFGSVQATVADMENIINAIEPIFEVAPLSLTYEITTVIVRTTPGPYTTTNPDLLLAQFRSTWNSPPESFIRRDLAHLFTGKDLDGDAFGIATIGTGCDPANAYAISASHFTSNFLLRKALTAHMLAHIWGAQHCDLSPPCHIMCSELGGCDGLIPFASPEEIAQMLAYLEGVTCLDPLAPPQSLPLCEDWPSGRIDPATWSYVNGAIVTQDGVSEPGRPWSLNLDAGGPGQYQDDEIRSNGFLLEGKSDVEFSYRTQHRGVEAGEQLVVEYLTNTLRWTEINRVTSDGVDQNSFTFYDHVLPSNAYHDEFRIRFRTEVNSDDDDWFLDDISLNCECLDPDSSCCLAAADCADINSDGIRDDRCIWSDCAMGVCTLTPITFADMGGLFGACPPDGFVNLFDRNHALTCFAGISPCDPINSDAGGAFGACAPDGFCNVFDANHALTTFAGTNPCTCPASPAPQSPPGVTAQAELSVRPVDGWKQPAEDRPAVAGRRSLLPGENVAVQVFVDAPLENLQSYQLHLQAGGGRSGRLELIEIQIEPRRDGVFAGAAGRFDAFNTAAGQMLAGLDSNGVATAAGGYLATFTYHATADAAGIFVIDVLHDAARGDQTFLVANFTGRIEVARTTPAIIEVRPHASKVR